MFVPSCQAYLEAFYKFCSNLGGTTADTMCPILEVSLHYDFRKVTKFKSASENVVLQKKNKNFTKRIGGEKIMSSCCLCLLSEFSDPACVAASTFMFLS